MSSTVSTAHAFHAALHWSCASLRGRSDEFYANHPDGYEAIARVLLGRNEVAASIRAVVDGLGTRGRNLAIDAACGTGLVTHALAGSATRVIGIDQCAPALAFARASKDPSLEFRKGDLNDFSAIAPGSVDVFSMAFACRYIRDLQMFYANLAQSLAPEGVAVIATAGFGKRLAAIEANGRAAGLSMEVVRPAFRSLFNRLHCTAHAVLRRA